MKNRCIFVFMMLFLAFLLPQQGQGQNTQKKKTVLEKAHDRKIEENEFVETDKALFLTKVYSVDEVSINKTHHWFLKLISLNKEPVNYADVEVTGYFKDDPTIKFKYMNPVFKLCSEGKYIIGFVKVKNSGTWVLDIVIDNFGKRDTLSYEIEIGEKVEQ